MKSNSVKNKKEIDNKKPPIKEETKSEKKEEPEKKEITEEMEKKMYEGQEHIEETQVEQKILKKKSQKIYQKKKC